jgi:hypothetical protein
MRQKVAIYSYLVTSMLLIGGCGYTSRPDGTVKPRLLTRLNPFSPGEITAAEPAFVPYHIGAIALFMFGVVSVAWSKGSSKTGWVCIGGAGALSAWATVMPKIAPYISLVLIIGAISLAGYLAWKFLKR